ncbi:MAG: F0F1 ATP synthase subunit A [Kiritimatiellia bacterium]
MFGKLIIVFICFINAIPLLAETGNVQREDNPDISKILFEHVLNSHELHLFPGIPAIDLPFGITVHLLMLWLAVALTALVFLLCFRKRSLKIHGPAVALEALVIFVRDDIVYPIMGEKRGEKWLPFFATLFIFVVVSNCLGLIPAFRTATGNINVTAAMAAVIFVLMFISGMKNLGCRQFFSNMYPADTPWPIAMFIAFLELTGTLIKSLILSLRLFANMLAGHLAILSFLVLIFIIGPAVSLISVSFAVFTYSLEVIMALIQAFVFTLLSCIFITMASSSHAD